MSEHLHNPEWLRVAYAGQSIQAIATELGVSSGTVRNAMIRYGIARRAKTAHMAGRPKPPEQRAKMSVARKAYWDAHPEARERDSEFRQKMSASKRTVGVTEKGYPTAYDPDRRTNREHRLVVQRELGRHLDTVEIVHHDNRTKSDNRPANLVVTSRSEHGRIHMRDRVVDARGRLLPLGSPDGMPPAFRSATHKECINCRRVKARTEFSPVRNGSPGRDSHTTRCKRCCADDAAERRANKRAAGLIVLKGRRIGERHWKAKLTWAEVDDIRARYTAGKAPLSQLSAEHPNSRRADIARILRGKTWIRPGETVPNLGPGHRRGPDGRMVGG